MPRPQRFALADLFALDAALGAVVRTTSEPMVGQIRLAWWRERLAQVEQSQNAAEPTLDAAAVLSSRWGIEGNELAVLADGWEALLTPFPWPAEVMAAVAERGRALFRLAATIAGAAVAEVIEAGALWALVDVAKQCSDERSRDALVDAARAIRLSGQVSERARPLTMLGLLARRDLERWPECEAEASPGRAWLLVGHRLTGRL